MTVFTEWWGRRDLNSDLQVSLAQLQWVIILTSADPRLPLEPAVLAKLHYDPTGQIQDCFDKKLAECAPLPAATVHGEHDQNYRRHGNA